MSLKGSGKVGINVGSPTDGLHLSVTENVDAFRVQINGNTRLRLFANGGTSFGTNNISGTPVNGIYVEGNTGLGIDAPTEKLEVDGAIVIGSTTGVKAGAIRYHNNDFEGFNGSIWVSLTKAGNEWGNLYDPILTERMNTVSTNLSNNNSYGHQISSDGDYAIVGTWGDDISGGTNQGSAFIYKNTGDQIIEEAKLTASNLDDGDYFGQGVVIVGSFAFVGAPKAGNIDQGAVYIFEKINGTWTEQTIITASDGNNGDNFGYDIDSDGTYLVVGAPHADIGNFTDNGAAYVFYKSGGVWTQQAKIVTSDTNTDDYFPSSVAIDGVHLVCGRYSTELNGADYVGSAFIFERAGTSWIEKDEIFVGSGALPGDYFGSSVDIDGDLMVVGAPNHNGQTSGYDVGRVSFWHLNNGVWNYEGFVQPDDLNNMDKFGSKLSLSGNNLIVCAPLHDFNLTNDGAAYHYHISATENKLLYKYVSSNLVSGSSANSVAIDGTKLFICGSDNGGISFYGK